MLSIDWKVAYVATRTPDGNLFDEPLGALQVSPGAWKLTTIPVFEVSLSLGDIVELDADNFISRVVEHSTTRTRRGIFELNPDMDVVRQRLRAIRATLTEHGITVAPSPEDPEMWPRGAILLAVPREISDDDLLAICLRSVVKWDLVIEDSMPEME
jgi:hypothetical protein